MVIELVAVLVEVIVVVRVMRMAAMFMIIVVR